MSGVSQLVLYRWESKVWKIPATLDNLEDLIPLVAITWKAKKVVAEFVRDGCGSSGSSVGTETDLFVDGLEALFP